MREAIKSAAPCLSRVQGVLNGWFWLALCKVSILEPKVSILAPFGLHFGIAYQLRNDYLDYFGDSGSTGKNAIEDLLEDKIEISYELPKRIGKDLFKYKKDLRILKDLNLEIEEMFNILKDIKYNHGHAQEYNFKRFSNNIGALSKSQRYLYSKNKRLIKQSN